MENKKSTTKKYTVKDAAIIGIFCAGHVRCVYGLIRS